MVNNLFVDEENVTGTMDELFSRKIDKEVLYEVVSKYAFDNFHIDNLKSPGGSKIGSIHCRNYCCGNCEQMTFRFGQVDGEENMYVCDPKNQVNKTYWGSPSAVSEHQRKGCGLGKRTMSNFVILNDRSFQKLFHKVFSKNPFDAASLINKPGLINTLFEQYFSVNKNAKMRTGSPSSKKRICNAYICHMREKLVSSSVNEYSKLPLWLKKFLIVNHNSDITVVLQCDSEKRFLRLYVGLPLALHVGKITMPFLVCDGHHYRTSLFDGVIFGISSRDGYGNCCLLSFSIIPVENIRHSV